MKDKVLNFCKKNKKLIIGILSAVLVLFICFIIFGLLHQVKEEITSYKTLDGEEVYYYIGTMKYEFSSKMTLNNDDEIINMSTGEYETELGSDPIYYKNEDKVLFPSKMSIVQTNNNFIQNKLNNFTTIKMDNEFRINNGNLKSIVTEGFLYDGNDLYFLLTPSSIYIDGNTMDIPAFSYVIFNYNKELYVYNRNYDTMYYYEYVNEDVIVNCGSYSINLGFDSINYNGGDKLLMKNFNYLSKYE